MLAAGMLVRQNKSLDSKGAGCQADAVGYGDAHASVPVLSHCE